MFWTAFRKKWGATAPRQREPLLRLTDTESLSEHQTHEGVFVLGATGSGKSSGSMSAILRGLLREGAGGVLTTTKPADTQGYLQVFAEEGRLDSVILFGPKHRARFNPFAYEAARPGDGRGVAMNVSELLGALLDGLKPSGQGGNDPYWPSMTKAVLLQLVAQTNLAGQHASFMHLKALHASAPRGSKQLASPRWRARSVFWATLMEARRRVTAETQTDLDLCEAFWLLEYAGLAPRTRSIIDSMVSALLTPFQMEPLRNLFGGETTVCPEMLGEGAILLLDMPVKLWNEVGVLAQTLIKFVFQRALERRVYGPGGRTVFFLIDEYQHFAAERDVAFAATARSAGIANVFATQNLPILHAAFDRIAGSGQGRNLTFALIGNLATKFLHANTDHETNTWASEQIGKVRQRFGNVSIGLGPVKPFDFFGGAERHTTAGSSEQLTPLLEPHEFARLRKGGPEHGYLIDAIVLQNGRTFGDGRLFLPVVFRQ